MSKGAISADMVSEAFRMATSEGGLFYGAIEAASETTAGRMASIRDTIEEIKVSIFNTLGDFGLWISTISEVMVPLSQIMPLLTGIFGLMSKIKLLNWAGMWSSITVFLYASRIQMMLNSCYLKNSLYICGALGVHCGRPFEHRHGYLTLDSDASEPSQGASAPFFYSGTL